MVYKDSPYLTECLDSLKNQTVESNIYISTSTPSAYISELAKKFSAKVFVAPSRQGIAHDWNFSLQQAKTKYVTLAHQDDLYMPEYAASCFKAAEKFPDALISFTGYTEIVNGRDRSNTLLLRIKRFMLWFFMPLKKNIYSKFWKGKLLSLGCPIAAPSVMYNSDMLSGFQFSSEFSINMDWEGWCRMVDMKGKFIYIKKRLFKHRIHLDSATSAGLKSNLRQKEDLIMFKKFWPGFIANLLVKLYARSYNSNNELSI